MMKFTLYKARLKTAGKTPEQIKADYEGGIGPLPSDEEIQSWIKVYDLISGTEITAMKSPLSDGYCPVAWDEIDDDKFREFVYQAEQDPYFGTYVDEREEFLNDWKTGEYCPTGTLTFDSADVEIIEEIKGKEMEK